MMYYMYYWHQQLNLYHLAHTQRGCVLYYTIIRCVSYLWLAYLKNRARYSLLHLDQVKVPVLELRVGDMMVPELWWQLLSVPSWNIPKL